MGQLARNGGAVWSGIRSELLKSLKVFTSKGLSKAIAENLQESRKEWMLALMEEAGEKNSNVKHRQFWQQHNKPIELWTAEVIDQKVEYIHCNPVVAGFITEPHHFTCGWCFHHTTTFSGSKSGAVTTATAPLIGMSHDKSKKPVT